MRLNILLHLICQKLINMSGEVPSKKYEKSVKLIILLLLSLLMFAVTACSGKGRSDADTQLLSSAGDAVDSSEAITKIDSLELSYATQFSVDYYSEGYIHIHIEDGKEYVIVPEGKPDNNLGFEGVTFIRRPADNIYLAASSAMDLFARLDGLDDIKACSTSAEDYSMPEVQSRIEDGIITYVGKYSAPDYETLMGMGTDLAIESTMIYHTPEVKEQLEKFGIPVIVERSSYEEDPLGRLEWIKLYGIILGKEEMAESFFEEQSKAVQELKDKLSQETVEKKTVAFFYVSSNGYINVRKPGDYLSKMIQIAGGNYALGGIKLDEENALSTVNINWEDFYREAKDADILIYNGTIDGGINSIDDLTAKNELFSDFRAVREGNVWCTNMNLFQETSKVKEVIEDFYTVINEEDAEPEFLYRVK